MMTGNRTGVQRQTDSMAARKNEMGGIRLSAKVRRRERGNLRVIGGGKEKVAGREIGAETDQGGLIVGIVTEIIIIIIIIVGVVTRIEMAGDEETRHETDHVVVVMIEISHVICNVIGHVIGIGMRHVIETGHVGGIGIGLLVGRGHVIAGAGHVAGIR